MAILFLKKPDFYCSNALGPFTCLVNNNIVFLNWFEKVTHMQEDPFTGFQIPDKAEAF